MDCMELLQNLLPYIRVPEDRIERRLARTAAWLLFLTVPSGLLPAFLNRVLFDRVIPEGNLQFISSIAAMLVLVEGLATLCRHQADRYLMDLSRLGRMRESRRQISGIWKNDRSWFSDRGAGGVLRLYDDSELLGDARAQFLRRILGPLFPLVVLLVPMFFISVPLASLRILLSALPPILDRLVFRNRPGVEQELWTVRTELATRLTEGWRCIQQLRIAAAEESFTAGLRECRKRLVALDSEHRNSRINREAVSQFSSRLGFSLSPALAVFFLLRGDLSFGSFIAFSIIAGRWHSSVNELLSGLRVLGGIGNAEARRRAILGYRPGQPGLFLSTVPVESGGLTAGNLSYCYTAESCRNGRLPVLNGLSFHIAEGEWIQLRGKSGAGKTTLLSIILGLLSPDTGDILYGGTSLCRCPSHRRPPLVGGLLQDPGFFTGTVRENLCLFSPGGADNRLYRALGMAGASDIADQSFGGLDRFLVSGSLSKGELQRLALARLMLQNPRILILDEPFGNLDTFSRELVADALIRYFSNRILIFVDHSPQCVLPADRSLNLVRGSLL